MLLATWIAVLAQGSADRLALPLRVARQNTVLASRLSIIYISIIDY